MKNNFNKLLLEHKIIDEREIYFVIVKKRDVFPSFKILVMGLNRDNLVIYQINTSYKLKSYIESINIKDIKMIDINNKRKDSVLNLYIFDKKKSYFILENVKNAHLLKKILKK